MASGRTCALRYVARHGGRVRARAQPARGIGGHAEAAFIHAIVASLHRLVRRIDGTATTP